MRLRCDHWFLLVCLPGGWKELWEFLHSQYHAYRGAWDVTADRIHYAQYLSVVLSSLQSLSQNQRNAHNLQLDSSTTYTIKKQAPTRIRRKTHRDLRCRNITHRLLLLIPYPQPFQGSPSSRKYAIIWCEPGLMGLGVFMELTFVILVDGREMIATPSSHASWFKLTWISVLMSIPQSLPLMFWEWEPLRSFVVEGRLSRTTMSVLQ